MKINADTQPKELTAFAAKYDKASDLFTGSIEDMQERPYVIEIRQHRHPDNRRAYTINVNNGYYAFARFTLEAFPTCCAMVTFHNFYCHSKVKPEVLAEFLEAVWNDAHGVIGMWFANRRLIVNMVEDDEIDFGTCPYKEYEEDEEYDEWYREKKAVLVNREKVIDTGYNLQYKPFFDYFQTKNCRLLGKMFNKNSDKYVHMFEVIV